MTRTCLISIYGPQNIIPAIAAIQYYGIAYKKEPATRVITVVHNPGLPEKILEECAGIVHQMIQPIGWESPIVLNNKDIEEITKSGIITSRKWVQKKFREKIGSPNIDEIFFCHNLVGYASDLCLLSFPDAEWIAMGDGFGFLYDQTYLNFLSGTTQTLKLSHFLSIAHIKGLLSPPFIHHVNLGVKTRVCAIIPYDWSGEYLKGKELTIIPCEFAYNVINECVSHLNDIDQYCRSLIKDIEDPCYVLIMSNFFEAQLLSLEDEVKFWEKIIWEYIPKGATIIMKPHPFSVSPLIKYLINIFNPHYNIEIISELYNRYPIELLLPVIERSQIISFATTVISLPYLFHKDVINPMTEEMILSMFPQKSWDYLKDTQKRYEEILQRITNNDHIDTGIVKGFKCE